MRISAGILKGRLVLAPEGRDVRPTSAKVRESIFDTLQGEVKGCMGLGPEIVHGQVPDVWWITVVRWLVGVR